MGLLSGLIGNASSVDVEEIQRKLAPILAPDERVELAFQFVRDQFVFTDRRLMLIDKQGLTGRKVEYLSIPYKSITRFAVETAGHFDLDAELKLWVGSEALPIVKELRGSENVTAIQQALAATVLAAH
ncbi:MAG: PH domain-containing protein [Chromatiaceae bacterium]|nr:PH domain-containing protein [Chromatiaceae bacterium]